jgi:c-di-GMP-binding flagellar brake protein YcgR
MQLLGVVVGEADRRVNTRVPVDCPALVEYRGVAFQVTLVDLSLSGACLEREGAAWPEPGSDMLLCLLMRDLKVALLSRMVRQWDQARRAGVNFEGMKPETRAQLLRFVEAEEKKILSAHIHTKQ